MNTQNSADDNRERAYLLEYADIFRQIEEIGSDRDAHHRLPELRARLFTIRQTNAWGHDMMSHLEIMAKVARLRSTA